MAGDQTRNANDNDNNINNKSSSSSSLPETVLHAHTKAHDHEDGATKPNPDKKADAGKNLCENINSGGGGSGGGDDRNYAFVAGLLESLKLAGRSEEEFAETSTKQQEGDHGKDKKNEKKKKKKKLVIFDLNGLLIFRVHQSEKNIKGPMDRRHDALIRHRYVYKRPYVDEFLKFCLERFEVGIWSSAMDHNIADIIKSCFKGLTKENLLFTWNQSHCTDHGFKSPGNKFKPLFFKELKKVWDTYGDSPKGPFSSHNTLLIDDSPYKALLNPPNTGVFPITYNVQDSNDDFLNPKGFFASWLNGLAEADDVPSYVEAKPFGQPGITSEHSDWVLYSGIRRLISSRLN